MLEILDKIISSSEVLALLIPLFIIILHKPSGTGVGLLKWYVIIAFIVNLAATIMYLFHSSMPDFLRNNNILYNVHSVSRVIFFSLYILEVRQYRFKTPMKILLGTYVAFCIYNFTVLESPFFLSSNLFSAESIVLLIMCLAYFFQSIQDEEETNWLRHPSFMVCSGIIFYEAITFFIFLFFYPVYHNDLAFSLATMRIYAITFVILCILLGMALYRSRKRVDLGI